MLTSQEDSLYPYINNDIEYGLFEDIVKSYHLDSQIKDDFLCDPNCYTQTNQLTKDDYPNICTHNYQHIAQHIDDLSDPIQQNKLYLREESALSFTDDERSRNLDRSFRNIYIIPSFPTREQHAHSVQNARLRFNKLNQ